MLIWCSYCQKYISQNPPYDNFSVSHGICKACFTEHDGLPDTIPQRIRDIAELFSDVWSGARSQHPIPAADILERSEVLNVSKSDLLLGFLQPILVKIGNEFEAGALSVATEHEFSQAMTKLISLMQLDENSYAGDSDDVVDIIIVCADGNYHSIGPYFLKALLTEQGANVRIIAPGLPLKETAEQISTIGPRCVGISLSLASQVPFVNELGRILKDSVPLFVGGSVFQTPESSVESMLMAPAQLVPIEALVEFLGLASRKPS